MNKSRNFFLNIIEFDCKEYRDKLISLHLYFPSNPLSDERNSQKAKGSERIVD